MSLSVSSGATSAEASTFALLALRPETQAAIASMGITEPTPIQVEALPILLAQRDLIGQAKTGSGKTLAFAIPAIERVNVHERVLQVLILTPTRELAVQVGGVLEKLGANRGIKTALIFGGRAMGPQRDALRRGVHIVVGTPGRVDDLFNQGALKLDRVAFLVLDEADEMLDRGFGPQVNKIIVRTPSNRQTALFSATVPDWVHETAAKHLHNPALVSVDPNPGENLPIEHIAYDVLDNDKFGALRDLLDHRGDGQMIVFGRTKHGVKKLDKQLAAAGYPVGALQGNLSQNARDKVMEDFRAGRIKVLLATNVAARGLDIAAVDQIVNFELPESPELLTHRVGRTGRMGRAGRAITLLAGEDGAKWRQLERGLNVRIPRQRWAGAKVALDLGPDAQPTHIAVARPVQAQPQPVRPNAYSSQTAAPIGRPTQPQRRAATREASRSGRYNEGRSTAERASEASWSSSHRRTLAPSDDSSPSTNRMASGPDRERHSVVCTTCGETTSVNFRPDLSRPVYCSTCYEAVRGPRPERSTSSRPRPASASASRQPNRR